MCTYFSLFRFRYKIPLEKGGDLPLNKLEFPSLKMLYAKFWLKLAQWFWRRRKYEKFATTMTDNG